jgi:hypothetical protein
MLWKCRKSSDSVDVLTWKTEYERCQKKPRDFCILVTGETSDGKSTLINHLLGRKMCNVAEDKEENDGRGTTKTIQAYEVRNDWVPSGMKLILYDLPGWGDADIKPPMVLQELKDLQEGIGKPFDAMLICARADSTSVKNGIRLVVEMVDIAFVGVNPVDRWQCVALVGTQADRCQQSEAASFVRCLEEVNNIIRDNAQNSDAPPSIPSSHCCLAHCKPLHILSKSPGLNQLRNIIVDMMGDITRNKQTTRLSEFCRDRVVAEDIIRRWNDVLQRTKPKNEVRGFAKYSAANVFFLLVLMGTEMDMVGLLLSAPIYLEYDPIFNVRLIIFGVAFLLLLFITMLPCMAYCVNPDAGYAGMDDWAKQFQSTAAKEGADRLNSFPSKVNLHGGEMKLYHWIPCLRFYCIVKSQYSATDVDAIFRVNSTSSFSLGVFQLIGLFATLVNGAVFNLYVKINVATKCLDWFLSFCYFGTGRYLFVASQARTLSKHFQGILQDLANKEVNSFMVGDFEKAGERSKMRKQQEENEEMQEAIHKLQEADEEVQEAVGKTLSVSLQNARDRKVELDKSRWSKLASLKKLFEVIGFLSVFA